MIWKLLIISLCLAVAQAVENVRPEVLDALLASGQDEKLAELLGIEQRLVRPENNEERSEESLFNEASFLGDIVLPKDQDRSALDFNYYRNSKWDGGNIPYYISTSYSEQQKNVIERGIGQLNSRVSKVRLVPYNGQRDYVFVYSANGCWSYVGKRGGQQPLSLQSNGCVHNSVVIHEFIHAIGFTHEHNRKDRDENVRILWDNIPPEWHSQYRKVPDQGWRDIGRYDHYSIMHYTMRAPGTNLDAFELPRGVDRNRVGREFTNWDVWKIDVLYW